MTEKGYESESYSESEEDSKAATKPSEDSSLLKRPLSRMDEEKKVKEKSQKKASVAANKATKQASITGFFQKKWTSYVDFLSVYCCDFPLFMWLDIYCTRLQYNNKPVGVSVQLIRCFGH